MRTTLDISEDVFYAAKDFARTHKMTLGEVISSWAREKFTAPATPVASAAQASSAHTFFSLGFATFPKRADGTLVSNEAVNRLRQQEGI